MDTEVMPPHPLFDRVVRHFGSQRALARILDVTPQAVSASRHHGFSPRASIEIERLSGGVFRAVDLVRVDSRAMAGKGVEAMT